MSYQKIHVKKCFDKITEIFKNGKTPYCVDTSGTLATFFEYNGRRCDVGKLVVGAVMGSGKSNADIGDEMRLAYINGCKHGDNIVYYLGQAVPSKWAEMCSSEEQKFNPELIFDAGKCLERDTFAKIVTPMEDFDSLGNQEIWPDKETTTVCMLIEGGDDVEEKVKQGKEALPKFDELFEVLVIHNEE